MTDFANHYAENARLIILRFLHEDTAHTSSDALIQRALETFGIMRPRDFTRTQLNALKDLGAVSLMQAGTAIVATLTRAGIDHVERRSVIAGVQRPSPAG